VLFSSGFMLHFIFYSEDGLKMFLRNIIIAVRRNKKMEAFGLKFINKIHVDYFLFTAEQMEGYYELLLTAPVLSPFITGGPFF
jgi:hypothetical protein